MMPEPREIMIRSMACRLLALLLGASLFVMPLALNSRSLIVIMDECGTVPAPMAEEEEVKHAYSIGWTSIEYGHDEGAQDKDVPVIDDPYSEVEHGEVAVPPPKC